MEIIITQDNQTNMQGIMIGGMMTEGIITISTKKARTTVERDSPRCILKIVTKEKI